MRIKTWLIWPLLALALLGLPLSLYAQDYSFSLDRETVEVWVHQDGSIRLEYWFTFTCDPGAHSIDVVDLGLPNGNYNLSDIYADVDGKPISRVDSDYQGKGEYGVALWLGANEIRPGRSGTVHVVVERVGGMVYEDSRDPEYASIEFSPTWFGSEYVHGTTDMTVRFHLPAGVQPEEPRWHSAPSGWPEQPQTALDDTGRVLYTWHNPSARADRQYTFGASFPRRYLAAGAVQTPPSLLERAVTTLIGIICNPVCCFFAAVVGIIALSAWAGQRRKMQYLPPSVKVEGVGVKRGLTAVEAAILLETPLNKVLTMILFGLLKKGAVAVLDDAPLRIRVNTPIPEGLREYEKDFLGAVQPDGTLDESRLRDMMTALIKSVSSKIKGFSRQETVAYYRDIVRRAWEQVEGAEVPEVRGRLFDEGLEWTMLDDQFEERTNRVFSTGPVYVPLWWGYYRPWAGATATAGGGTAVGDSPTFGVTAARPSLPTLPGATFAATIVKGIESTSSRIVRSLTGFTGAVTAVTNPPPPPSSGGRRYGGGGCACACACAGCACACAGGGR
ncbi:MAG: hypothetical protein N2508_06645 [Anaerolineae bacterium]|nr:hypothetical protein [Anaerolineae bacterium]